MLHLRHYCVQLGGKKARHHWSSELRRCSLLVRTLFIISQIIMVVNSLKQHSHFIIDYHLVQPIGVNGHTVRCAGVVSSISTTLLLRSNKSWGLPLFIVVLFLETTTSSHLAPWHNGDLVSSQQECWRRNECSESYQSVAENISVVIAAIATSFHSSHSNLFCSHSIALTNFFEAGGCGSNVSCFSCQSS